MHFSFAQRTAIDLDARSKWDQAVQWFYEGRETLAYPIFLRYQFDRGTLDQLLVEPSEADYFRLACGVRLDEAAAVEEATLYVNRTNPAAYRHSLAYYLADHHFRAQRFAEAQHALESVDIRNLRTMERVHHRFMFGYAHFIAQRFDPALAYFDSVRTEVGHPDYFAANYYYGFIALRKQNYPAALATLRLVEDHPDYRSIVPYYIGQLYYLQGQKNSAIEYVERKLKDTAAQYYELPLKQLLGHAYFEKRQFDKALPLLKEYVGRAEKVRREDVYELSYCYHQSGQYAASIPGFRDLAGGQDSLSQHAMYLLGDAYIKTGDLASARNAFRFCASNNSYQNQREVSLLQYAKLSYELSFLKEAQSGLEQYLVDYPSGSGREEAQELMVRVLSATNNFRQALQWIERIEKPSASLKKSFPRIWFGRAMELVSEQLDGPAQKLLDQVMQDASAGNWRQQAKFWSGEIAFRRNDYSAAINYMNDFLGGSTPLGGDVSQTNARYTLGYAHLKMGNYTAAGDQFQLVTKNIPGSPSSLMQDAWLRAGDCHYMRRDYNKAKPYYERAVSQQWLSADYAQFQLALIAGIRSNTEKIRLLQTITERYASSTLLPDTYLEMANAWIADRKFKEAIPVLDRVIGVAPQESWISRALLMQGVCHYNLDAYEESLSRLQELVRRYPSGEDATDALENIRQVYLEMGKPDEFVSYMQGIGRPLEYPVADSLTYSIADRLYGEGQDVDAIRSLRRYLEDYPKGQHRLKAFYQLAELTVRGKDWPTALIALDSLINRRPHQYEEWSWRQAARITYFEQQRPDAALRYYNGLFDATRNQSLRMEALRGAVRCYHRLKDWSAGVVKAKLLLQERDATPDDKSIAHMVLAQHAISATQWPESIESLRSVLSHNKGSLGAEARYLIAWIYYQQGKWSESEKAAEESIRLSGSFEPWSTKSYILIGDVYYQQKDYFNAKATYQSVAENTDDPALKEEAKEKYKKVEEQERKSSKLDS